jgi:hypothetical protein
LIPIFTFVTDRDGYSQMRHSFELAGFTPEQASFTELTGTGQSGEPEPYSTITRLVADLSEPFFILCHQDLRLDQGHRIDDLIGAVRDLEERDDRWAVAGNAGGTKALRVVRSLADPHGGPTDTRFPARVHSLDENFLVIRTGTELSCSPQLSGFHLYGTDLCLNALDQGRQPYVIDFRVRHLSRGTRDAGYARARDRLVAHWGSRFVACYVRTTIEVLFLSRLGFLQSSLGSEPARGLVKSRAVARRPAGALLAPRPRRAASRTGTQRRKSA